MQRSFRPSNTIQNSTMFRASSRYISFYCPGVTGSEHWLRCVGRQLVMNRLRHPHATYVGTRGGEELGRLVAAAKLDAGQMSFLTSVGIDGLVPGETTEDNAGMDEEDNVGWKYDPVGVTEMMEPAESPSHGDKKRTSEAEPEPARKRATTMGGSRTPAPSPPRTPTPPSWPPTPTLPSSSEDEDW